MQTTEQPRVIIVDDDDAARQSLEWLLNSLCYRTQTYSCGEAFLEAIKNQKSLENTCLILDLRMPKISGCKIQHELKKHNIELPIIFLTAYATVSTAVNVIRKGAVHFMTKPYSEHEIIDAINLCLEKSREISQKRKQSDDLKKKFADFSDREKVILDEIMQGKSNKNIARMINLSVKTVEYHRANIMKKTASHSLAELIRDYVLYQLDQKSSLLSAKNTLESTY